MKTFVIVILMALTSVSRAQSVDDFAGRWVKQYADAFQSVHTWPEFFEKTPGISSIERTVFAKRFANEPFPKLTVVDDHTLRFDNDELKLISLENRDFRYNGHYLKIPTDSGPREIFQIFKKAREKQTALLWFLRFSVFPEARAKEGATTNIDATLLTDFELAQRDFTRPMERDEAWLGMAIPKVGPVMGAVYGTDWVLTKGENYLAKAMGPSCDKQVKEISELAQARKLAVEKIDCGSSFRGNDRSVSFWTPGPDKKPMKREFVYDLRANVLQETVKRDQKKAGNSKPAKGKKKKDDDDDDDEEKDKVAYFFKLHRLNGDQTLEKVRKLESPETKDRKISEYNEKSKEFPAYYKNIEPIRQVMYYMGKNKFCENCADSAHFLQNKEAPKYIKGAPSSVPAELRSTDGQQ